VWREDRYPSVRGGFREAVVISAGELAGENVPVVRAVLGSVEVDAAGNIARLHDITLHLGAADLAPYLARTGSEAF
jgi:hypothetical protein